MPCGAAWYDGLKLCGFGRLGHDGHSVTPRKRAIVAPYRGQGVGTVLNGSGCDTRWTGAVDGMERDPADLQGLGPVRHSAVNGVAPAQPLVIPTSQDKNQRDATGCGPLQHGPPPAHPDS